MSRAPDDPNDPNRTKFGQTYTPRQVKFYDNTRQSKPLRKLPPINTNEQFIEPNRNRISSSSASYTSYNSDEEDLFNENPRKSYFENTRQHEEKFKNDLLNHTRKGFFEFWWAEEALDLWWEHAYAHGVRVFPHNRSPDFVGINYLFYRIAFAAVTVSTIGVAFSVCAHFARLFYATYWQALAVAQYGVTSLVVCIMIRIAYMDRKAPGSFWYKLLVGKMRPLKAGSRMPWYAWLTWTLHSISFSYACFVLLLYSAGSAGHLSLAPESVLAHFVGPALMIFDVFMSGILWSWNNMYLNSIFIHIYIVWTAIHHIAKLGNFQHTEGITDGFTCEQQYEYSLTDNVTHVYDKYDLSHLTPHILNVVGLLVILPIYNILVWIIQRGLIVISWKYIYYNN